MKIRVIRSKKQYHEYLAKVEALMETDPAANSEQGRLLETLAILIEAYEKERGWEIPSSDDPIHVIKSRMEDLGLRQSDLVSAIGDKTKVSRILSGSRKLTSSMVLPLSRLLRIPPEFLLRKA